MPMGHFLRSLRFVWFLWQTYTIFSKRGKRDAAFRRSGEKKRLPNKKKG